jgi:hypothetical protein
MIQQAPGATGCRRIHKPRGLVFLQGLMQMRLHTSLFQGRLIYLAGIDRDPPQRLSGYLHR